MNRSGDFHRRWPITLRKVVQNGRETIFSDRLAYLFRSRVRRKVL